MRNDPVSTLSRVLRDDLPQDWDISESVAEEIALGVKKGTIRALLEQIRDGNLWPELYAVAAQRPDQWTVDLSVFLPNEEAFLSPRVAFLMAARTEHEKVCWAQEAAEWPWSKGSWHLLPHVIERVEEIERGLCERRDISGPHLRKVVNQLRAIGGELR